MRTRSSLALVALPSLGRKGGSSQVRGSDVVVLAARSPRVAFHLDRVMLDQVCSWDDIVEWVGGYGLQAVGFDVYDTLLTRDLNDQAAFRSALARVLVDRGAWDNTAEDYLRARAAASRRAPSDNLRGWYDQSELAEHGNIDRCIEIELGLESEITRAVPGAADAVSRIRELGLDVAFVSDMHLPHSFIGAMLEREGIGRANDSLYVSGAVGTWKSDGGLFRHWLAQAGLEPEMTAYVGNHPYADWAVPASLGLRVKARRNANPSRYETDLGASSIVGATVAAASTRARLALDPSGHDVCVAVGTSVVGQTMTAFLLAIRARCRQAGIGQVLFVARDGDLLLQMANAMNKDYWAGIELRYLEGNRLAWTLAGAHAVGVDSWIDLGSLDQYSFLMLGRAEVNASSLIRRLGLTVEEVSERATINGLNADRPLPDVEESWSRILADRSIRDLVAQRAIDRFDLVCGYVAGLGLRQEQCLIVDVGWRGQSAAVVSGVFDHVLGHQPLNYHFGGYGVRAAVDATCWIERYAFDDSKEPPPFHGIDQCVEMFTCAGQPRAVGYEQRGTDVVPVHDDGVEAMSSPQRDRIWEAALRVAEMMPPSERVEHWTDDLVPDPAAVVDVLRTFWTTPTRAEGHLGSHLKLEVDDEGRVLSPMSAPYGLGELRTRRPRRWRQGSAAMSALPYRLIQASLSWLQR